MAVSNSTFSDVSGAVGDLFAASGDRAKAAGDRTEAQDYGLASDLAAQNEQYTETSTAIKIAQQQRQATQALGATTADVAGAGFSSSGSALDLLRDSASQGALTKAVLGQQGLITEAGYTEQQKAYTNMQGAANAAADAEDKAAQGSDWTAAIKGVAAVASVVAAPFTGGLSLAATPGLDGLSAIH